MWKTAQVSIFARSPRSEITKLEKLMEEANLMVEDLINFVEEDAVVAVETEQLKTFRKIANLL